MREILGVCSGDIPHTFEAWPIYLSRQKVAKTLQIEARLSDFIQIVAYAACAKTDTPLWKLTANGQKNRSRASTKARSWIAFFLTYHPDTQLSTTQIGAILNRDHTTVLFYRRKLLDLLTDHRFGAEAYAIKHINDTLESNGFTSFDLNPFMNVKRLRGIRGQPQEGAAA